MKKIFTLVILIISAVMATAQNKIYLSANGQIRSVTLSDNPAAKELINLLKEGPVKITMSDYGGFEKVGELPQSFTTSNSQITTQPGDIMLYQGDQMVIFYGSNSWSYTRLGKIDNATASDVKEFLGTGTVEVTVSLTESTGVDEVSVDANTDETVYDLNGRVVAQRPPAPGIYIKNRKKIFIK